MPELNIEEFKRRLSIFVGIVLAAVISISVWSIATEYRDILSEAEKTASGYAQALSEHTESAFAETDRVIKDLIHDIKMAGGAERIPQAELYELLRRQGGDSPQIGALFITGKNGIMFNNSQEYPPRQIDVSDREYFRHYLENPAADLYLSKPVMSRLVKRWRFNLIRPLNPPGTEFAGFLAVAFEVDYFKKFFTASSIGSHGRIAVFRTDGTPLVFEPYVHNIYGSNMRNSELFRIWLPSSPSGTFHASSSIIDKTPRIISYKRLSRFPAVAAVSLNRDDVLEPWTRKALLQGAVTFALCLVIVSLTRLMFRHLDRLNIAQTGLRSHQERLRIKAAQIDAANDAILQIDHEGRLVHFNQALCRMSGFSHDELTDMVLHDLEPPESVDHTKTNLLLAMRDGEAMFDAALLAKDGSSVPIEVHAHPMESGGGAFLLCIARDVRERKRSEMRELARLMILEKLATGAPLASLLDQIVYFVEQQIPGAIGSLLLADETGKRLLHGAAPSLPEEYNQAVHGLRIAQGMGSSGTAAHLRQPVIVDDITRHPYWKGFQPAREAGLRACWSQPVLSSDGELLGAFAVYHREPHSPDDRERALLESAAHLASIAIGRVRQEEEREHLEGQLRHIQRIEAIGQLAGGIAHDFNNLLTPIFCYADMIKRGLPQETPQAQMAESILKTAHKAKGLTQKLLSFGRRQRLNMQPLDLNEAIQSFHDILRCTIRENIAIRMNLAPGTAPVMADRGQIEQMLLNLAVNAQDAIKGNGTITINTGHVLLDDEYARLHPGMQPGPHILLAFADNGHGMDDETLSHIFEPFFTTKQVGHGTGLGLATVFGTVKQHEGYVAVESRVGKGTTFTIYLPAKAQTVSASAPEPKGNGSHPEHSVSSSTVLVVEDNRMVREMIVQMLKYAGYGVLVAPNPDEAYEIAQAAPYAFDLLLSDVIMPGMNGPELFERLQRLRPDLPVVFISGYTNEVKIHNCRLEEGGNFLPKPFTSEQLLRKVSQALSTSAGRAGVMFGGAGGA
ncbi:response regulator [Geobacter hydrogenophilus]|uniref:histidine kinase n=1 Tax=Geobacter hydrogenophilus TaxID=40983 RepID=A0A9W6LBW7_9BACT|nr:response regulator [Geobacter hydrogenophilus]MBT0895556.1 response regulator [Geobacter hydrogenophilus]GLI37320.1 hypothetical protein GHYDROH2_08210 [Geobacter hydrogenophilus]